jgi:hypothetical protein
MGKKRIAQLLEQLEANHQADVQNAAAIYTVAQVAVNQLEQQVAHLEAEATLPAPKSAIAALPISTITTADLKQQYQTHTACRRAAKAKGIRFRTTPSWETLASAFNYFEQLQTLLRSHLADHRDRRLKGVSLEFKLDDLQN